MGKLARESMLFDAVNMHSRVMEDVEWISSIAYERRESAVVVLTADRLVADWTLHPSDEQGHGRSPALSPYPARMRRDARTHFMRQNTKP